MSEIIVKCSSKRQMAMAVRMELAKYANPATYSEAEVKKIIFLSKPGFRMPVTGSCKVFELTA